MSSKVVVIIDDLDRCFPTEPITGKMHGARAVHGAHVSREDYLHIFKGRQGAHGARRACRRSW